MPAQRIIDLDAVVPETIGVKIDGEVFELPGDIPVPTFLAIGRLLEDLGGEPEDAGNALEDLYERTLELFRVHQSDLEELPIGPKRLGTLIVELYTEAAEADEGKDEAPPPSRRNGSSGTRSTPRKRTTRKSASSK